MRMVLAKESKPSDKDVLMSAFEDRYGTMEELDQRVQITRCSDPQMVDDLMVWRSLRRKDTTLTEKVHYRSPEMISVLTPRRLEVLKLLRKENEPLNVTEVAQKMKRDYKNVYDDIKALSKVELIERRKEGRDVKVGSKVRKLTIYLDDSDIYY